MATISVNVGDATSHIYEMESCKDLFCDIKSGLSSGESKSKAMDELRKQAKELEELLEAYREQFASDLSNLSNQVEEMRLQDSTIGSKLSVGNVCSKTSSGNAMGGAKSSGGSGGRSVGSGGRSW